MRRVHEIRFLRAGIRIFQIKDHGYVHAFSFHGNKTVKEFLVRSWSSSDLQLRRGQGICLLDQVPFKNYMDKDSQRTPVLRDSILMDYTLQSDSSDVWEKTDLILKEPGR